MFSEESSIKKPNFQLQYAKIKQQTLTTTQAVRAVLGYHKSIDRIKQILHQISKSEREINVIQWNEQKGKVQFFRVCEDVYDFMENKESQSRRQIGEMNQQILKMQKSLTDLGIELCSDEIEKMEQIRHKKEQTQNMNKQIEQKKQLKQQTQNNSQVNINAKQNQNQITSTFIIQSKNQQTQQHGNTKKQQQSMGYHEQIAQTQHMAEQQQKQKKQEKNQTNKLIDLLRIHDVEKQKEKRNEKHLINQHNKQHKIEGEEKTHKEKSTFQVLLEQFSHENKIEQKSKQAQLQQGTKQQLQNQQNTESQNQKANEINYEIQSSIAEGKQQELRIQAFLIGNQQSFAEIQKMKTTEENQSNNPFTKRILQNKLTFNESQIDLQSKQKAKQTSTKWTEILLQNKPLHQRSLSLGTNLKKKYKYNPYEEISKYECRKRHKYDEPPKNQLQSLHQKYRQKLRDLFPYLLKQMKSSALTFDGYPNSLDVNSFSSFLKNFNLNGICKPKQVLKHFKKCAINGIWLNEEGFLVLNAKILGLPEHIGTFIDGVKAQKQKYAQLAQQFEQGEMQINEFQKDKGVEKKRKIKAQLLNQIKKQTQIKESHLMQKLKQINAILSQLGNKFIAKGDKNGILNENHNYDPERLRKIVDAHSGICPQDIFEQFHIRKRQNERLNELKVKKIIEKYQVNNNNKSSSEIRGLNKNINSLPNIHTTGRKAQEYSKMSKGKLQSLENKNGQRLKSEGKYEKSKSSMEVNNQERQDYENKRAAQFDKKRSSSKISKKQKRNQSIYHANNKIQTRPFLSTIKSLIQDANDRIFEECYSQQKMMQIK